MTYIPPPYETPRSRPMKRKILIALAAIAAVVGLSSCGDGTSNADKAAENLSIAAENFEIQRRVVAINGITDVPLFLVEGKCSIETSDTQLVATCKHSEGDLRKHYIGISDNTNFIVTQLEGYDADEYHTRVILKPETLIPNFDLETSGS